MLQVASELTVQTGLTLSSSDECYLSQNCPTEC